MSDDAYPTLPRHEVALVIAGQAYLGWTTVSVDRGIDSLVGSFTLGLTARERTGATAWPIHAGDACEVVVGGKALITGYIDRVARRMGNEDRAITISGRDKAADLVDCSALNAPGSWRGVTLEKIARELAAPFGVSVSVAGGTGKPLAKFALQQGETAWAAIERLARYRGLIAFSDGKGGIHIGNPDSGRRAGRIAEGRNLLSIGTDEDHGQRFSQYLVKGQASGSDARNGTAVAQVKASASDPAVTRYRPLMIIGEEQSDQASLAARATWEKTVRAGRAETSTIEVPGWFAGDGSAAGPVWEPGARAELSVPSHGLSGDRLIERVVLVRDEGGSRAEMTVVPPEAWAQLAEDERRAA